MTLTLPLILRYCSEPARKTVAWLLAGDDPAAALRAWECWRLPMVDWKIAPLGKLGWLTILAPGQSLETPANALPLGSIGEIYLPTHAALSCAVTEKELATLLPHGAALVILLPGASPIVVAEEQLVGVADLLLPPPRRSGDWSRALPGGHYNERLISVRPAIVPTIEAILQAGRDDIGSRDDLRELPPRPSEPGDSMFDQMRRSVQQGAAGFMQWMTSGFGNAPGAGQAGGARGSAGGEGSWLDSLAKWSKNLLGSISKETEELRHREILRLMEMLKNNPEEGLKYAIPFGGGEGRGMAPPGSHLFERPVDFSLRNLGGGGPIDYWNLPDHYYQELAKQYRALANRELQLGRYRRAAFIFAELLHELHAAASALEAGGDWREAAILYRTKLNQPLAAAQCLERGGLLDEAIEIYGPLGFDEKVGDLYARLERREDAESAWRRAIDTQVTQHRDYLKAAAIARDKLCDDERTLEILNQGWNDWNQPGQCLSQIFSLLGQRGRHSDAELRLRQIREVSPRLDRDLIAAETLIGILAAYPDRSICQYGRDVVLVLAGARLRSEVPERQRRWARAVESHFREDRLVASDGRRFVEGVTTAASTKPRPNTKGKQPRLEQIFMLTQGVIWRTFSAQRDRFYAVGISNGGLRLVRGDWTGRLQSAMTVGQQGSIIHSPSIALAIEPQREAPIKAAVCGQKIEGQFYFGTDDLFGPSEHAWLQSGVPSNSSHRRTAGLSYALGMLFELVASDSELLIHGNACGDAGQTALHDVLYWQVEPDQLHRDLPAALPTYGTTEFFAVGFDRVLHCRSRQTGRSDTTLAHPILSLAGTAPFTRLRLAAGFASGGAFLYASAGHHLGNPIHFAEDITHPQVCFTGSGMLVAVGENGGEIYRTEEGKLTFHQNLPGRGIAPLAVVPVEMSDRFAVVYPSGEVQIYNAG